MGREWILGGWFTGDETTVGVGTMVGVAGRWDPMRLWAGDSYSLGGREQGASAALDRVVGPNPAAGGPVYATVEGAVVAAAASLLPLGRAQGRSKE